MRERLSYEKLRTIAAGTIIAIGWFSIAGCSETSEPGPDRHSPAVEANNTPEDTLLAPRLPEGIEAMTNEHIQDYGQLYFYNGFISEEHGNSQLFNVDYPIIVDLSDGVSLPTEEEREAGQFAFAYISRSSKPGLVLKAFDPNSMRLSPYEDESSILGSDLAVPFELVNKLLPMSDPNALLHAAAINPDTRRSYDLDVGRTFMSNAT